MPPATIPSSDEPDSATAAPAAFSACNHPIMSASDHDDQTTTGQNARSEAWTRTQTTRP